MATFYEYADRTATDYVDWGKIASDLSTTLLEQKKIREDKKAAIDKANRESYNTIANAPTGEDSNYSNAAIDYSTQATQHLLMVNRLLKSGQMDYKDFLNNRQNLMDDTNATFTLLKDYQDEYSKKMKKLNEGKLHGLSQFAMSSAEGYGNLNEHKLIIDPTTGRVYSAKYTTNENGERVIDNNPNNYAPVQSLKARIKSDIDKFDSDEALKKGVDMMGSHIEATKKYGRIDYFKDITKRKATAKGDEQQIIGDYEKAEKLFIHSLMNPINSSSVLTDYVMQDANGNKYTYTFDKAEAEADKTGTKIYVEQSTGGSLIPKLTDKQNTAVEDALKARFRIMLDNEHKIDPVTEATKSSGGDNSFSVGKQKTELLSMAEQIKNLRNGDPDAKQSAATFFQGLSKGAVLKVDTKDPKGVTITTSDNRTQFIPYGDNMSSFADRLTIFTGNQDPSMAMALSGYGGINTPPTTHNINAKAVNQGAAYSKSYVLSPNNKSVIAIGDYYDNNIYNGWNSPTRFAYNLKDIIDKEFSQLPQENVPSFKSWVKEGKTPYVNVFVEGVTTKNIGIPTDTDDSSVEMMKAATAAIHDASTRGIEITAADLSPIFADDPTYQKNFNTINGVGAKTETTSSSNGQVRDVMYFQNQPTKK